MWTRAALVVVGGMVLFAAMPPSPGAGGPTPVAAPAPPALPQARPLRLLKAHRGGVTAVAFAPDGKRLASAGGDGVIRLWDPATGKDLLRLAGHRGAVAAVVFSPDGRHLVSGGVDRRVLVWWAGNGARLARLGTHQKAVVALAFSPAGKALASAGADSVIRLWDWPSGQELRHWSEPQVQAVAFSPGGKLLASGGYQVANGWGIGGFNGGFGGGLVGNAGGTVPLARLWEVTTGHERLPVGSSAPGFSTTALAFSPDGRTLAIGGCQFPAVGFGGGLGGFQGGGGFGVMGGGFGGGFQGGGLTGLVSTYSVPAPTARLCVWELLTGRERWHAEEPLCHVRALAASPDGKLLASAMEDGMVLIWDAVSGAKLGRCAGHRAAATSLAFAPDGKRLASGSLDGTVRVWEVSGLVPRRPEGGLAKLKLASLWTELGDPDAARAGQAIGTLLRAPRQAGPFLRREMQGPPRSDRERIARLIADLDSDRFAVRQRATRELERLGSRAGPALRRTLEDRPASLEVYQRVQRLLARLQRQGPSADYLRKVRALEVLERLGTREAREIIAELRREATEAWLAREAKESLARLAKRPAGG